MNLLISLKYFRLKSRISSQREAIDKPLNDISWKIVRLHRNEHEIQKQKKKQKNFSIFFLWKRTGTFQLFLTNDFLYTSSQVTESHIPLNFLFFFIKRFVSVRVWCYFLSNDMHLCVCDVQWTKLNFRYQNWFFFSQFVCVLADKKCFMN